MYEIANRFVQNCVRDNEFPANISPLCCIIFVNDRIVQYQIFIGEQWMTSAWWHFIAKGTASLSLRRQRQRDFSMQECQEGSENRFFHSEFYDRVAALRSFYDASRSFSLLLFRWADLPRDRPVGPVLVVASPWPLSSPLLASVTFFLNHSARSAAFYDHTNLYCDTPGRAVASRYQTSSTRCSVLGLHAAKSRDYLSWISWLVLYSDIVCLGSS